MARPYLSPPSTSPTQPVSSSPLFGVSRSSLSIFSFVLSKLRQQVTDQQVTDHKKLLSNLAAKKSAIDVEKYNVFLKIVSEEDEESSTERANQERYLAEAINSTALRLENASQAELTDKEMTESADISTTESVCKYNNDKFSSLETIESAKSSAILKRNEVDIEKNSLGEVCVSLSRKVTLLFELLSACVADTTQDESPRIKKGYDARYRTALRLLATWLDVKWIKLEAMEMMLSCSAITAMKDETSESDETESEESSWSWKRGGIIGAAALTGGTLMAITGGVLGGFRWRCPN